jgi:hypothetical protein
MPKDLELVVNDDRLAFATIAQTIFKLPSSDPALDAIRKQCEDRIVAIDTALGDT